MGVPGKQTLNRLSGNDSTNVGLAAAIDARGGNHSFLVPVATLQGTQDLYIPIWAIGRIRSLRAVVNTAIDADHAASLGIYVRNVLIATLKVPEGSVAGAVVNVLIHDDVGNSNLVDLGDVVRFTTNGAAQAGELRASIWVSAGDDGAGLAIPALSLDPMVAATHFDGVAKAQSALLTGEADSTSGLFSCWFKGSLATSKAFIKSVTAGHVFIGDDGNHNGALDVILRNAAASILFEGKSAAAALPATGWNNLLLAYDTNHGAGTKVMKAYVNDANVALTLTDAGAALTVDYTDGGYDAGEGFTGDLAEVWFGPGQFLDLTVTNNRRKFITAGLKPVQLGPTGNTPTGSTPQVYLTGDSSVFGNNAAGKGAFTVTGTLTDATTSPSS